MRLQKKSALLSLALAITTLPTLSLAEAQKKQIDPIVAADVFSKAKENSNWKSAFATGQHAQVVFMNVSPDTNPNNEIGMETHQFDQIIFVAEGEGKADLGGKASMVKAGDMIFIPQGTAHNVINLNKDKPLKILSVYSSTDIPANSNYKKKSDATE